MPWWCCWKGLYERYFQKRLNWFYWDHLWHDKCTYHDLEWFDEKLPYSEDSTSDYAYYVDGKKQRCSNAWYKRYLIETTSGNYTEYRSRDISYKFIIGCIQDGLIGMTIIRMMLMMLLNELYIDIKKSKIKIYLDQTLFQIGTRLHI